MALTAEQIREAISPEAFGGRPAVARPALPEESALARSVRETPLAIAAASPLPAHPSLVLPSAQQGFALPGVQAGRSERLFVEGRVILPGATGAASSVAQGAAAVANAEGIAVAASPDEAPVCTFTVPERQIAVLTGYYARPASKLGYDAGHVRFMLDIGGRRTQLPVRLLGLRGDFEDLIPVSYAVGPTKLLRLLATNGSNACFHVVEGVLDLVLVDEAIYRRFLDGTV